MSRFQEQQSVIAERKAVRKESEKTGRETLGKYYYDLSKLAFATSVLGSGGISFLGDRPIEDRLANLIAGVLMTVIFAILGHRTIKFK